MKKKTMAMTLGLVLCLGLALPAVAAGETRTVTFSEYGGTIKLEGVVSEEQVTLPINRVTDIFGGEMGRGEETFTIYHVAEGGKLTLSNDSEEEYLEGEFTTISLGQIQTMGYADVDNYDAYGDCDSYYKDSPVERELTAWGDGLTIEHYCIGSFGQYGEVPPTFLNIYFVVDNGARDLNEYVSAAKAEYARYEAGPWAYAQELFSVTMVGFTTSMGTDRGIVLYDVYALKDENGYETNYVGIRELANALTEFGDTADRYQVTWADGAIQITTKTDYEIPESSSYSYLREKELYTETVPPIFVDGKETALSGIVITDGDGGGHTYYKLRDLGAALGIGVGWDGERGAYLECAQK